MPEPTISPTEAHAPSSQIASAVEQTLAHLAREGYRGWDPYDALRSPLFGAPPLRSAHFARFAAQQLLKRSPLNIRPLLRIPKGLSPVTVALAAQAHAYLAAAGRAHSSTRAVELVAEAARLRSRRSSRPAWGYEFDWAARRVELPADTPTVVATGTVANALFVVHGATGDEQARELCLGAADFVRRELHRTPGADGTFCWSYSPNDTQVVLNASLKGARCCAQAYALTGDGALCDDAVAAARFVACAQRDDGSWPYALGDERSWVDHYHTAYVLDCLDEVVALTGEMSLRMAIDAGLSFYRTQLFEDDLPRFRSDSTYPIDATCCGQALLTLCRFGDVAAAERCAGRALALLARRDGAFAYQAHRHYVNRIPYARWSAAWMLVGLARLLLAERSS